MQTLRKFALFFMGASLARSTLPGISLRAILAPANIAYTRVNITQIISTLKSHPKHRILPTVMQNHGEIFNKIDMEHKLTPEPKSPKAQLFETLIDRKLTAVTGGEGKYTLDFEGTQIYVVLRPNQHDIPHELIGHKLSAVYASQGIIDIEFDNTQYLNMYDES